MKTYLSDTFNRFIRYSEKLDAQTVLCNKCWWVFNDAGEKETYIFKEDGSVLITFSGAVTYGKWEYLPVNKSVIISGNNQSFMVIPSFLDECILALQVDGTNNYAFLIDEQNKYSFAPKTYKDVIGYFEEKERTVLEALAKKELERVEEKKVTEEKKVKSEAKGIIANFEIVYFFISILSFTLTTVIIVKYLEYLLQYYKLHFDITTIVIISLLIQTIIMFALYFKLKRWYIKRYIRKHPNNPQNPYLEREL